jgi:outer membrane protein assembly factor BamD
LLVLLPGCGRKPYENPIATNSQQPDKILFDKAVADLEKRKYQLARLTLTTLLNTYPDSEYMAKAKLAIADSWYREGTSHAMAQAEAEYKDFIVLFPTMEESAESQMKVCRIHYDQMLSADRDNTHAMKADQECRQMLLQYPNSRHAEATRQLLRETQEVIADAEFRVGSFYAFKGSYRAGANRLQAVTDHYPLYSRSDEALWMLGQTYESMGEEFSEATAQAYAKLVRDYPLSPFVDQARERLVAGNYPIPEPDPSRYELMKYNLDRRTEKSLFRKTLGVFGTGPKIGAAAKTGDPALTAFSPSTPTGVGETQITVDPSAGVSVKTISGESKLDTEPDARRGVQGQSSSEEPQQEPQQQQQTQE